MLKTRLQPLQTFQLLRFTTSLLIGILLAKVFGVSTGEIAIYEVLLFLGNFFSFFWLSAGIKSILSQYNKSDQPRNLLINLAFILLLFGCLAAGILFFFQDWIIQRLTQFEQLDFIRLLCLYLIFNAPGALIEYIYLLQKKEHKIVPYGLVLFSSQLMTIVLPLILDWGLLGIFSCLLIWSFAKFIWLIYLLFKSKTVSTKAYNENATRPFLTLNWSVQKQLLIIIFPLSLHMLIGGGMEYIDGFIVTTHFSDMGVFAIFRYGARELPLATIFTAAVTATLIPLAVENQAIAIQKIKQEIDQIMNWLFPITTILMLSSPYLFPLVYNDDFTESAQVFNIYLLIISSRIILPQVIIYAEQHNFVLVGSALVEVIINLGLSLYWVENYGLSGIAFATVVAYLVNKIILISYTYFVFGIPLESYLNIGKYFYYNFIMFTVFLFSTI